MSTTPVSHTMPEPVLLAQLDDLVHRGRVRLDRAEREALAHALAEIPCQSLELFGSRVATGSRGGDIDVLVLTSEPAFQTARRITTRFFSRCEERIDAVVIDPESASAAEADFLARLTRVPLF